MSFTGDITNGYLPNTVSSEPTNTINQWNAVCLDTTATTPAGRIGVVRPDSANAGVVAGVNESTGVDTTGGSGFTGSAGIAVQPGNVVNIAFRRISKVVMKTGDTVTSPGVKLYVAAGDNGLVTVTSSANKFLGYALEATTGGAGEMCSVLVHAMGGV